MQDNSKKDQENLVGGGGCPPKRSCGVPVSSLLVEDYDLDRDGADLHEFGALLGKES